MAEWWNPATEETVTFDVPVLEVDYDPPEPSVLYGPDGAELVTLYEPVGFARALIRGSALEVDVVPPEAGCLNAP